MAARSHRTEAERQTGLARRNELLDVVTERERTGRDVQVERVERAPGPLRAGREMVEEHVRVLGHERCAEPAVGDFPGHLEAAWRQRRQIDRDARARLGGDAQGLALAAGQR